MKFLSVVEVKVVLMFCFGWDEILNFEYLSECLWL